MFAIKKRAAILSIMLAMAGTRTSVVVRGLSSSGVARRSTTTTPRNAATPGLYNQIVKKNVAVPGLKNGMDYQKLGDSDLLVSKVCMGTMTFGEQNTIRDGVEQLSMAFDEYGINFLDTAEMYPVPTRAETQGTTDKAVAQFLKSRGSSNREDIVLATKLARENNVDFY